MSDLEKLQEASFQGAILGAVQVAKIDESTEETSGDGYLDIYIQLGMDNRNMNNELDLVDQHGGFNFGLGAQYRFENFPLFLGLDFDYASLSTEIEFDEGFDPEATELAIWSLKFMVGGAPELGEGFSIPLAIGAGVVHYGSENLYLDLRQNPLDEVDGFGFHLAVEAGVEYAFNVSEGNDLYVALLGSWNNDFGVTFDQSVVGNPDIDNIEFDRDQTGFGWGIRFGWRPHLGGSDDTPATDPDDDTGTDDDPFGSDGTDDDPFGGGGSTTDPTPDVGDPQAFIDMQTYKGEVEAFSEDANDAALKLPYVTSTAEKTEQYEATKTAYQNAEVKIVAMGEKYASVPDDKKVEAKAEFEAALAELVSINLDYRFAQRFYDSDDGSDDSNIPDRVNKSTFTSAGVPTELLDGVDLDAMYATAVEALIDKLDGLKTLTGTKRDDIARDFGVIKVVLLSGMDATDRVDIGNAVPVTDALSGDLVEIPNAADRTTVVEAINRIDDNVARFLIPNFKRAKVVHDILVYETETASTKISITADQKTAMDDSFEVIHDRGKSGHDKAKETVGALIDLYNLKFTTDPLDNPFS